jgi:hypothetical protein
MQIHPILAGLGACLIGSLGGALLLTLSGFTSTVESASDVAGGTLAVGLYGFVLALPVVFLYGMPTYAILSRFSAVNLATVVLFGALPGIAWVTWSRSSWLDPILWHGTLIAVFYYLMRQWNAKP